MACVAIEATSSFGGSILAWLRVRWCDTAHKWLAITCSLGSCFRWPALTRRYCYRQAVYHITITRLDADSDDANQLFLDGEELAAKKFPLIDDHHEHAFKMKVRQLMKIMAYEN
jgi:hypothetical protein